MRWLQLAICCSIALFWCAPAWAHAVVLLRPMPQSASTTELLERLRGELLSVGFEVSVRDRPSQSEPSSAGDEFWQQVAAAARVDAAVDLVGDPAVVGVDVWIVDGTHHFQRVARVAIDSNTENAFKGAAIRASEVLRARLFEKDVGSAPRAPSPAIPPAPPPSPTAESESERTWRSRQLGIELGAAVLASLDGVGPALLPLVRFDWALEPALVLQATLAGFGTRPNVATAAGSAEVAMQYGLFGACYRMDWEHWVKPLGSLSLGALRTAVVGQAELPREGHSVDQWSMLLDASLGTALQLSHRYTLVLEGHAQLAQPYVAIHFGDQKVASMGRPNLLLTLTLGVWP